MQKTTFFSMILLALVSFSSFTPKPSGNPVYTPTRCDLWAENNTSQVLTTASFLSPLETSVFSNVPANTSRGGSLAIDTDRDVVIELTFNTVPSGGAVATIYADRTLRGTLPIAPGVNRFTLNPPLPSGAIYVYVNPN